ncbi:hypothetical protein PTSG_03447 [Salpingoeca rosetta]|uniref:LEM domain-containing protein n=1 Tax=Salpingoeca rosetta (strain ATCC 50818 / BSB-021) TaxID=946362 RepID=F2U581_SALR5|nr:uncharacterized protein PTSG_03447 [Salpingoeca rosetta]EGD82797.1 hypothetical protein PTSG_03447 [Salpingoeca rosetta]|eukprot:XP_004996032.1 hypothetical protein PTSG_03447 [Salpingoeca rosetta]
MMATRHAGKMMLVAAVACLMMVTARVAASGDSDVHTVAHKLRGSLPESGARVLSGKSYYYETEPQPLIDPQNVMRNPLLLVSEHIVGTSDNECKVTVKIPGRNDVTDTQVSFSPFTNATLSFSKGANVDIHTEIDACRMSGVLGGIAVMILAPALVAVPAVLRPVMFLVSAVVYPVSAVTRDSRPSRLTFVAALGVIATFTLQRAVVELVQRVEEQFGLTAVGGALLLLSVLGYTQLEATGQPEDLRRYVQIALQLVALIVIQTSCQDIEAGWVIGMLAFVVSAWPTLFNGPATAAADEGKQAEDVQEQEYTMTATATTTTATTGASAVASPEQQRVPEFAALVSDDEVDIDEDEETGEVRVRQVRTRRYITRAASSQEPSESLLSDDEEPSVPVQQQREVQEEVQPRRLPQRTTRTRPQRTRSATRAATRSSASKPARSSSRKTRAAAAAAAESSTPVSPSRRVYNKDEVARMSNQEVAAALKARGIARPVTESTRRFVEKLLLK